MIENKLKITFIFTLFLEEGGTRRLDNSMNCSVAVKDKRAFIFYHVEPWRRYDLENKSGTDRKRIHEQPL